MNRWQSTPRILQNAMYPIQAGSRVGIYDLDYPVGWSLITTWGCNPAKEQLPPKPEVGQVAGAGNNGTQDVWSNSSYVIVSEQL